MVNITWQMPQLQSYETCLGIKMCFILQVDDRMNKVFKDLIVSVHF